MATVPLSTPYTSNPLAGSSSFGSTSSTSSYDYGHNAVVQSTAYTSTTLGGTPTITETPTTSSTTSSVSTPLTSNTLSGSSSFTPYISTSTPFSGSVSQYQNNQLQQTDYIYQNQRVMSQPVGADYFNYYGPQGGNYSFDFASASGMNRVAFSQNAFARIDTSYYPSPSISPSISPLLAFGLPSTSGMGFAGIGEAFLSPLKIGANFAIRTGETVLSIGNFIGYGKGNIGFVNGYDARLNPIKPVTGLDYVKQFSGYSVLTPQRNIVMPFNTLLATSIIAENPVKPTTNLIGVENRVTMVGTAADLKPQVNTNFFFRSDMPSAGGLMSEPYFGVAKGTLKVNSFSEVGNAVANSQTGRGAVVGAYQPAYELLSSSGTPTIFTSKQFMISIPTSSSVIDLYSSRQINLAGEVNVQKTIGEVSTINPATLEAYSSKGFIGRSINFEKQVGETSVQYLKGDTTLISKGVPGKTGSFEGVVFKNPVKTGTGSGSDIVSFQGGGKPSSEEFFRNLYANQPAVMEAFGKNVPKTLEVSNQRSITLLESGSKTAQNLEGLKMQIQDFTIKSSSAGVSLSKSSTTSTILAKSLPSVSYASQIPQSQYYGTGQYERTSEVQYQMPKMNQLSLQSNIQSNIQTNLNIQPQFQTPFQTQINIQPQIQNRLQVQNNIQTQIQNQLQVQNQITTTINPPIVPPPIIPTINPPLFPPFKFLPGGSSDLGLRNFGSKKSTRYIPDFGSLLFGRKGKYRKGKLSKSGLDIRPITPGFSFQTGLGNAPLASNTFEKFRNNLGKTKLFKTKSSKRRKK